MHAADVSILVVVDWSRQPARGCGPGVRAGVSILVVVDWSRQQRARDSRSVAGREVSILVVVDWSRQRRIAAQPDDVVFQSLLWWIGRVNPIELRMTRSLKAVSILVVVDRSRQRTDIRTAIVRRGMFQSLLWWIGRVNPWARCHSPRRIMGFNPCCGGLVASTRQGPRDPGSSDHVSILVVVDRSRQQGRRTPGIEPPGFNPCCGGLVASTAMFVVELIAA